MSYKVIGTAAVALVLAACVTIGVTVGGATRLSEADSHQSASTTTKPPKSPAEIRAELASALEIEPTSGTTAIAPNTPVVVKAGVGRLTAVNVTTATGTPVPGALTPSAAQWRSLGRLAYGTDYRVRATVTGEANVQTQASATFHTVDPPATVTLASVFPNEGLHMGVGQPVVFRFAQAVNDADARARVLAHLSVTASTPVAGGWHWFSNRELHYRPEKFWPSGDTVTVAWDLTGWDAGNGAWGTGDGFVHFDIGHARVSYADLASHKMTVTENGKVVATYPISGGKPTDPTMGGVHIVLDRASVVRMNSATNGVPVNSPDGYDELVYNDVHISDTGEYVHAAPWSVGSQGRANVSHGCINLSPTNAKTFFDFSRVGDIVVVTGSPRPPVVGDHGVMDWDTDWSQFTPATSAPQPPGGMPSLL